MSEVEGFIYSGDKFEKQYSGFDVILPANVWSYATPDFKTKTQALNVSVRYSILGSMNIDGLAYYGVQSNGSGLWLKSSDCSVISPYDIGWRCYSQNKNENPLHFAISKNKLKAQYFDLAIDTSVWGQVILKNIQFPRDVSTQYSKNVTQTNIINVTANLTIWWNNEEDFIVRIDSVAMADWKPGNRYLPSIELSGGVNSPLWALFINDCGYSDCEVVA